MAFTSQSKVSGINITTIVSDSRKVVPGALFVAIAGFTMDGHKFVGDALAKGCAAAVVDKGRRIKSKDPHVPIVAVADTREALGYLAAEYHDHPAKKLKLIGITGTNGKTTTSYLLEAIVKQDGKETGVIGTVSYRFHDTEMEAPLTTPDPLALQGLFRQMVDNGITHVLMEVSSHALAQKRLHGVEYDVAMFVNLSRDHLDFHGSMAEYYESKKKLFTDHLKAGGKAVVFRTSCQDKTSGGKGRIIDWGERLGKDLLKLKSNKAAGKRFSLLTCGQDCGEVRAKKYSYGIDGIDCEITTPAGPAAIHSGLVGEFNLANILCAVGAGISLNIDITQIEKGIEAVAGIPGRLQRLAGKEGPFVFVDYAHTPDALENVLMALRKLAPTRLIVVFGCGGDRDTGKRVLMGEVAGRLADITLLTSDNPRNEQPESILQQIEVGMKNLSITRMRAEALLVENRKGYDVICSRKEAIDTAIYYGRKGDILLISGKGHETYQITKTGRQFFDDRLEAKKHLDVIRW